MDFKIKYVHGHFEVYVNGKFCFSADTMREAMNELKEYQRKGDVFI